MVNLWNKSTGVKKCIPYKSLKFTTVIKGRNILYGNSPVAQEQKIPKIHVAKNAENFRLSLQIEEGSQKRWIQKKPPANQNANFNKMKKKEETVILQRQLGDHKKDDETSGSSETFSPSELHDQRTTKPT
jgi:hypothetical protein